MIGLRIGRPAWWARRGPLAWLLLPLGLLYALLDALNRALTQARRAALPTLCIGNFTAGGAGKTPVTLALARLLVAEGWQVALVSRGYGAQIKASVQVAGQAAHGVGDEPLLLARVAPTFVGPDRHASIALAKAQGAEVILLDDGLQHHRLIPDGRIEVRHVGDGLGNGFPLPAGPLRQWFGLAKADMQIVVGRDAHGHASLPAGVRAGDRVRAFCGIADPDKFWATLAGLGLEIVEAQAFPDHHAFDAGDLSQLRAMAAMGPTLTTEKDWVRLPEDLQAQVRFVPYAVALSAPTLAAFKALLARAAG